jgi:hypothetical protein
MKTRLLAGVCFAVLMAMPGFVTPTAAAQACLQKGSIHGWDVSDNQHMVVNSNVSDKFAVTLMGRCIGLQFAEGLAFRGHGGSLCIEPGDTISFRQNGIRQTCVIQDIKPNKAEDTPR